MSHTPRSHLHCTLRMLWGMMMMITDALCRATTDTRFSKYEQKALVPRVLQNVSLAHPVEWLVGSRGAEKNSGGGPLGALRT